VPSISAQSSSKIVKAAGKPRDIGKWNTCERTIKISNIPSWISSEELKIIFSVHPIERIHIPVDIFNSSFGIAFITVETIETHTCLMNNLGHENKFFFAP
ncbi:unnamed protein product, partial [Rotaria magnacalcarata]